MKASPRTGRQRCLAGRLPRDIEPRCLDRSRGICEVCCRRPGVEICSAGCGPYMRELAHLDGVLHVCRRCHEIFHGDWKVNNLAEG